MNKVVPAIEKERSKCLLNKLVLHPSFKKTIEEIRTVNLTIAEYPKIKEFDFSTANFPSNGKIGNVEELGSVDLDAARGQNCANECLFCGYDESKLHYCTLEGDAFFTSHVLVIAAKKEYLPVSYLSFYFYTRSGNITERSSFIKYSQDSSADSNRDYVTDRSEFLAEWSPENCILFIDGPLIGGNMTVYTIRLVEQLHKKAIIPVFAVKNSTSNLVTDNISELRQRYNSDLHWAYNQLGVGQRTNLFIYRDEHNPKNAKIFCYLKPFNLSPQRIEFHVDTYAMHESRIAEIMDLIHYLLLVNGDKKNPQARPIAISEMYARDVLKVADSYNIIKHSGLIPTMNQERFEG